MKIRRLFLLVGSILCLALVATAQTTDGPVYVVGAGGIGTGHVFANLADALAAIQVDVSGAPNVEAPGTTIVLYPGTHTLAATLNIDIARLTVKSLEGADRTQVVLAPGATGAVFGIGAPGVTIEDLQIVGGANTTGISVGERDCVLRDLIISNHRSTGANGFGVQVNAGADGLRIAGCDIFANEVNGIDATAATLWSVTIEDTTIRSNSGNGVALTTVLGATINNCTITGNGTGIALKASRNIAISSSAINNCANSGIAVAGSTRIDITDSDFTGNAAGAITLAGVSSCSIAGNSFDQNMGGAVSIDGASTLTTVENNVMTLQAGPTGGGLAYGVSAIVLGGANACTVQANEISGYAWGIALLAPGPQGNTIAGNTVQDTLQAGIQVLASLGDNHITDNTITSCGGNGITIQAGADDLYDGNTVTLNTLSGLSITSAAGAVADLIVSNNTISGNGVSGIDVSLPPSGVTNLVLNGNVVTENEGPGIQIASAGFGLRVVSNDVADNEAQGIIANKCPGARISYNKIHGNRNEGLSAVVVASRTNQEISWNSVFENMGGGLNLNLAGLAAVVENNLIYSNLGFGVQLAGLPVCPPPGCPLPYPQGFSLGSNWWGVSNGPSGFFAGTGNAVLGLLAASRLALAPILSAPPATSEKIDAERILDPAQVSDLKSFAAGTVVVDRTDTTGFKITFSGVSARSTAWVSLAGFTPFALSSEPWAELSGVVKSVAVLVSGLSDGMAQIVCEFSDMENPGTLRLYAYKGGGWIVDADTREWTLAGGSWVELNGCVTVGSEVVYGEIPVTELLGDVKAIALASSNGSEIE